MRSGVVVAGLLAIAASTGCGARSGLRVPDGSPVLVDVVDRIDATDTIDAIDTNDAIDVADILDVRDVAIDVPPLCADGDVQFIYVISRDNQLYSYYPPSNAFSRIGTIRCPVDPAAMPRPDPYSMAVDHTGTAYVVFDDGHLFRVSTATARCEATPYVPDQQGIHTFGMGYVANTRDPGETLFVAEGNFETFSRGLASIDTESFVLSFVGAFAPPLNRSELTGTGDGRLYAFSLPQMAGQPSTLSQIDTTTAAVIDQTSLAMGDPREAFAFAFWGNGFYIFTSADGPSVVRRYRPSDGSITVVTMAPAMIVGAGVSTCAPH